MKDCTVYNTDQITELRSFSTVYWSNTSVRLNNVPLGRVGNPRKAIIPRPLLPEAEEWWWYVYDVDAISYQRMNCKQSFSRSEWKAQIRWKRMVVRIYAR